MSASNEKNPIVGLPASSHEDSDQVLYLYVQPQTLDRWNVTQLASPGLPPICSIATDQVRVEGVKFAPNIPVSVYMSKQPAEGCVFVGYSDHSPTVVLHLLYRFGVVLALDDATHGLIESVALANEQDLAAASNIQASGAVSGLVI